MKNLQVFTSTLIAMFLCYVVSAQCPTNGITLSTQQQVDDFATTYPGCTEILGDLTIGTNWNANNINDLSPLAQVGNVAGTLTIRYCEDLYNLSGLENIGSIGNLVIRSNQSLNDITALSDIADIQGDLTIGANFGLYTLPDLNLSNIGGNLELEFSQFSLEGFENLATVGGDVHLRYYRGSTNFEGFSNLNSIGGNLTIESSDSLINFVGLENLTQIGERLTIQFSDGLQNFTGLENLTQVKRLYIRGNDGLTDIEALGVNIDINQLSHLHLALNSSLLVCHTEFICNYLNGGGAHTIEGNDPGCNSGSEIQILCTAEPFECLPGGITLQTQYSVDNFATTYPGCTEILGDLTVGIDSWNNSSNITNLDGISHLTRIAGKLTVISNDNLTSLTLPNLTEVGDIEIRQNDALTSLTNLGNLINLGELRLSGNINLTDLTGLENLTNLGKLHIAGNDNMTDLAGLENLTEMSELYIWGSDALTDISALSNITSMNNGLTIITNTSLSNLHGLHNLTSVGELTIREQHLLSDLDIFTQLNQATSIIISENDGLNNINGLGNITALSGDLSISYNGALTSLEGLTLTSIGNNITISSNPQLADISTLNQVGSTTGDVLIIDNDALTEISICQNVHYLQLLNIRHNENVTHISGFGGLNVLEDLNIYQNPALTNFAGFSNLRSVGNSISIKENNALTSLEGLSALEYVDRDFNIEQNDALLNLNGLESLEAIGRTMYIFWNDTLQTLDGLNSLDSIGLKLSIGSNYQLSDISSLASLETVDGSLSISGGLMPTLQGLENLTSVAQNLGISAPYATNLDALQNLTYVGNNCTFSSLSVADLTGLENLNHVGGQFTLIYNDFLQSFEGLGLTSANNVSIRYNDTLSNFMGFPITNITGTFEIYSNENLSSITGLENLNTVNILDIYSNDNLVNLQGLDNLSSITEKLDIAFNDGLTTLMDIAHIDISNLDRLEIQNNDNLYICQAENICNFIETGGSFYIGSNTGTCSNIFSVQEACANVSNSCFLSGVSFTTQQEIDDFPASNPNCTVFANDVIISETNPNAISNLDSLYQITKIYGDLIIDENTNLPSLAGLSNLIKVDGVVTISSNDNLTNLEGLNNLNMVGNDITIDNNANLTNLSGLDSLVTFNRSLHITNNPALTSLTGLNNLNTVYDLYIHSNDALSNFTGLDSLENIRSLSVEGNDNLVDFTGLENLPDLSGFLHIHDNDNLLNISALLGLTYIKAYISITDNAVLNSLDGLDNVGYNWLDNLIIYNNPLLAICDVESVCNYLNNNEPNEIYDNAPGCNSATEVINVCNSTVPCPTSLYLSDQQQIDDFPIDYPGCTTIPGSVFIENSLAETITNLDGLNQITSIGDYLIIEGKSSLTSIAGLSNLTNVGGYLSIEGNGNLTNLTGLENLSQIGGALTIKYNSNLSDINGLINIAPGTITDLKIHNNASLAACDIENICNYLDNNGTSEIHDNMQGCNDAPQVLNACNSVVVCPNIMYIYEQQQIDDFPIDFPGCTTIPGYVFIENSLAETITNLDGLNQITTIGGYLIIEGKSTLTSIEGLSNLTSIGEFLSIEFNSSLTNLTGLENLSEINGALTIRSNNNLTDIDGIKNIAPGLITDLNIYNNSNLAICNIENICTYLDNNGINEIHDNMQGCNSEVEVETACTAPPICPIGDVILTTQQEVNDFAAQHPNCTEITGDLYIGSTSEILTAINDLSPLYQLTSVQGKLTIIKNGALTSLNGLENLTTINSDLYIGTNPALSSLADWNNLTSVGGQLVIRNNGLSDLTGFNNLTSIEGDYLNIGPDATLTSLAGLENLTSIGGYLFIHENTELNSLNGLDNIDHTTIINLRILNNPQLNICSVQSVCNYLENNGTSEINNNAPGCNSQTEVETACLVDIEVPSSNDFTITPNPNTGIFRVNGIPQGTYQIHDTTGRIIQSGEMENDLSIDISQETQGVYFISIQMDNEMITKRIIKM